VTQDAILSPFGQNRIRVFLTITDAKLVTVSKEQNVMYIVKIQRTTSEDLQKVQFPNVQLDESSYEVNSCMLV